MIAALPVTIPKGRVKCPWMAVPIENGKPLVVMTAQLQLALRGVTVTDAAVIDTIRTSDGAYNRLSAWANRPTRALEIVYTHGKRGQGRGHGRIVLYDRCPDKAEYVNLRTCLRVWAEKQRENRAKQTVGATGKVSARAKQAGIGIRRLEKEKGRLYLPDRPPVHPLIPREQDLSPETDSRIRENELQWHAEKPVRRKLARIAGEVIKGRTTHATAYKILKAAGYSFKGYGDVTARERERLKIGCPADYFKWLYKSVNGLSHGPTGHDWNCEPVQERLQRHDAARLEYLANRRMAESLEDQIAALRELAKD
jgi:hypothetical protein